MRRWLLPAAALLALAAAPAAGEEAVSEPGPFVPGVALTGFPDESFFARDALSRLLAEPVYARAAPSRTPAESIFARGTPSRTPAEGSLLARGAPSRTPAEGSFLRGVAPSRTPAEGSFFARGAPSRTPAEGSFFARGTPSRTPAEGSPPEYRFGQSAALSGPASALGAGMRLGLVAAFEEVNRAGGVHGRRLALSTLDDAYEPEAALANTRELIEKQGVFALVGAIGTPTSLAAQPVASEAGVPYIAPFTGAEFLRDAGEPANVVNVRASYFQETAEIVVRLTSDLGIARIGIIYQDDSYGRAGLEGVRRALHARSLTLAAEVDYPRNTESVKIPLLDLRRFDPEAVIVIGAYKPAATLIRWARKLNFNPVFVNISFVGASALAEELGPAGRGVYITQVVPFPGDRSVPVVAGYQAALAAVAPASEPGFVSLEGYLAGRLVAEGLRRAGAEATPASFLETLRQTPHIDLGGFQLGYGPGDNQGSDRVWLTVIDRNGQVRPAPAMTRQ